MGSYVSINSLGFFNIVKETRIAILLTMRIETNESSREKMTLDQIPIFYAISSRYNIKISNQETKIKRKI